MSALLLVAIDAARVGDKQAESLIQDVLSSYVAVVASLVGVSQAVASLIMDLAFGRLLRHAVGDKTLTLRQVIEPFSEI